MEKVKPFLSRALVAFLFALGLTLPVLGALNLMGAALPCVALLIGLCAVLTAASMNRKVGLAVLIASVAGLAIYLLALGGIQTIREAVIGVILQLSGVQGALPMVAGPCAILLTLIGAANLADGGSGEMFWSAYLVWSLGALISAASFITLASAALLYRRISCSRWSRATNSLGGIAPWRAFERITLTHSISR